MHLENIEMLTGEIAFMVNTGEGRVGGGGGGGGGKTRSGGGRQMVLVIFSDKQNCPPFVSIDFKNARVQSKSYDN